MPAKSEKQRKYMARCYTKGLRAKGGKGCPSKKVAKKFMKKKKTKR
jgi:hypothetical protein